MEAQLVVDIALRVAPEEEGAKPVAEAVEAGHGAPVTGSAGAGGLAGTGTSGHAGTGDTGETTGTTMTGAAKAAMSGAGGASGHPGNPACSGGRTFVANLVTLGTQAEVDAFRGVTRYSAEQC